MGISSFAISSFTSESSSLTFLAISSKTIFPLPSPAVNAAILFSSFLVINVMLAFRFNSVACSCTESTAAKRDFFAFSTISPEGSFSRLGTTLEIISDMSPLPLPTKPFSLFLSPSSWPT